MATIPLTAREVLDLFVESVDELLASKYIMQARAGGVGSSIAFLKGLGVVMGRSGPDREYVKAVLLTLRFFNQDNEPTSLRNMNSRVQGLPIDQILKDRFSKARDNFNHHLKHNPAITYPAGIGADTNGDIFDTFLYGEFAHKNPDKKRRVEAWEKEPYFNNLRSQFDLTLLVFIAAVSVMRNVVVEIINTGVV